MAEYWTFLREHKMWWMVPLVILLLLLGGLLTVTHHNPLAPLMYSIF